MPKGVTYSLYGPEAAAFTARWGFEPSDWRLVHERTGKLPKAMIDELLADFGLSEYDVERYRETVGYETYPVLAGAPAINPITGQPGTGLIVPDPLALYREAAYQERLAVRPGAIRFQPGSGLQQITPQPYQGIEEPIAISGGALMSYQYNGRGVQPGDPPPGTSLMMAGNGQVQPAQGDAIGLLGLLLRGGSIALGLLRALVARVGWQTIVAVVGTAVAAKIAAMLNDPDDNKKVSIKKRKRRYSIGANPRLRTLIRVANKVDQTFNQYDKSVARFRSHVKGPVRPRTRVYVDGPPRKDLTVVR